MKKLAFLLLLPAMALLTACGNDDEPVPAKPILIDKQDMAFLTLNAATGEFNHYCKAQCELSVDADATLATATILGAAFDPRMPHGVDFTIGDVRALSLSRSGDDCSFTLKAASASMLNPSTGEPYSGYEITDIGGHVDTARDIYTITFGVNTRGTGYKVVATSTTLRTDVGTDSYYDTGKLYYQYNLLDNLKAEIYIHNVQFSVGGASSPLLPKIHIPDLTVVPTSTGYKLIGNGIIPNNITAGGPVPMGNRFVVTNFEATLNVITGEHHITFDCMGGNHTGDAALAL